VRCLSVPCTGDGDGGAAPDSSGSYPKGTIAVLDAALVLALATAGGATAIVALGMLFMHLRRTSRLTPLIGGLGAASAAAVLAPVALIAGLSSHPERAPETAQLEVTPYALENYQLDTLALP